MAKPILNLRVSLDKNISRDIAISSESSLYKLAEVINQIFGRGRVLNGWRCGIGMAIGCDHDRSDP